MKNLISLYLSFFLLIVSTVGALANDTDNLYQSAEIEEASLTLSDDNETAVLRFKITNQTLSNLIILGVIGPYNVKSQILVKVDDTKYVELGSISIEPEESLDLTTSHMFIRLSDLPDGFQKTGKVELNIILSAGKLPFMAHITNGS
ncbi:hypothetical protein NBZ79_10165 [Sneathiella marina]|uniref:Uncharacterized protein n=1 Tax=Sneathiella marina TaxID=2950108 RepID=A0ABY4VXJ1_9PROT|nr:hypothetical protein [Sneathiella marina]USG59553.1 hypothetical protein NBZ79_10165 [Sneathiella marina]